MSKKVYIDTLGCQMNKSDTERILGIMERLGYVETEIPKEADFLVMNTCSIRQASEDKAYSHLGVWGKWKRSRPDLKIAMCGCIAQQTKEKVFHRAPYVDLIFGTHNIDELPKLIQELETKEERVCSIHKNAYIDENFEYKAKRENGISAWLPIIEGCDYFCTYCVVPHTRGRQRSRKPEDILKEAEQIVADGYKEITLLGQTVDSYGRDFDDPSINLSFLLRELNKLEGLLRIRFVTSHPNDITDELINTVKELDKVCEYFHIPMQSGNTEVLDRMRRKYTRQEYIALVEKIRKAMPEVGLTSDFIAGFPGETEEQFEDTLSIVDDLVFDLCNTAAYSPRRQTPAAVWKEQLSKEIKKERLNILNERVKDAARRSSENYIGNVYEVLPEKFDEENGIVMLTGRTRSNKIVHFEGPVELIGTQVLVKVQESSIWSMKGSLVD